MSRLRTEGGVLWISISSSISFTWPFHFRHRNSSLRKKLKTLPYAKIFKYFNYNSKMHSKFTTALPGAKIHNFVQILWPQLWRSCGEAVEKLSRSCWEVVEKLSRSCRHVVEKLSRKRENLYVEIRNSTITRRFLRSPRAIDRCSILSAHVTNDHAQNFRIT